MEAWSIYNRLLGQIVENKANLGSTGGNNSGIREAEAAEFVALNDQCGEGFLNGFG